MKRNVDEALKRIDKIQPRVFGLDAIQEQIRYHQELDKNDLYYDLKRNTVEYKMTIIFISLIKGLKVQYLAEIEEGKSPENALYKLKKDIDKVTKNMVNIEIGKDMTTRVIDILF